MAVQAKEGYVDVPGGKIWYEVLGDAGGLPLVTLHGGPGSTHCRSSPVSFEMPSRAAPRHWGQ